MGLQKDLQNLMKNIAGENKSKEPWWKKRQDDANKDKDKDNDKDNDNESDTTTNTTTTTTT